MFSTPRSEETVGSASPSLARTGLLMVIDLPRYRFAQQKYPFGHARG
jgi:hypothetical protein